MPVLIYLPCGCGPARAGRASPKAEAGAIAGPGAAQRRGLTARAAMVYLHGSDERQRAIADAISRRAMGEFTPQRPKRSGTHRARKGGRAS